MYCLYYIYVYMYINYVYQQSLVVILPSMEFYMGCTDAEQNIDCLTLICCGLLSMLKITLFRVYARNLIDNYESAVNDYVTIENAKQRAIMRRHSFIGRTLCCLTMCFSYLSCLIYSLIPLLGNIESTHIISNVTNENSVREYIIPSKCILEYFNPSKNVYRIFCFAEAVALILLATGNVGNTYLLFNIII